MLATVHATSVATATVIASHDLKVLHVEPPVSVAALDPEGIAHSVLKPGDKLKAVNGKVVGDATHDTIYFGMGRWGCGEPLPGAHWRLSAREVP